MQMLATISGVEDSARMMTPTSIPLTARRKLLLLATGRPQGELVSRTFECGISSQSTVSFKTDPPSPTCLGFGRHTVDSPVSRHVFASLSTLSVPGGSLPESALPRFVAVTPVDGSYPTSTSPTKQYRRSLGLPPPRRKSGMRSMRNPLVALSSILRGAPAARAESAV